MLYISVTIACDECETEASSQPSVKEAVQKWRDYGGVCEDNGHSAVCEDCKCVCEDCK